MLSFPNRLACNGKGASGKQKGHNQTNEVSMKTSRGFCWPSCVGYKYDFSYELPIAYQIHDRAVT